MYHNKVVLEASFEATWFFSIFFVQIDLQLNDYRIVLFPKLATKFGEIINWRRAFQVRIANKSGFKTVKLDKRSGRKGCKNYIKNSC